jgi:hypothetical protein
VAFDDMQHRAQGAVKFELLSLLFGAVRQCLDLLGPVQVGSDTKQELLAQAKAWGEVSWNSNSGSQIADQRTVEMLQLIAATKEYQFA